jgi:ATP-binding cassette subfamily B protein
MISRETRWIFRLWRPFRTVLIGILVLTALSTIVHVSLPLVLKHAFDGLASEITEPALIAAVLLYLGLGTIDWFLLTILIFLRGVMNRRFEWEASRQAYAHLVRHAPGFFQRFRTGDLVTRLTDDVSDKLCWFICSGIFRTVAAGGVIVFAVAMMIRLDPLLTLLTAGPLPLLIVLFIRTGSTLDRRFDAVQQRISGLNDALEACFSGIRVVKAYGREKAEAKSFGQFAERCAAAEVEAAKSQILVDTFYGQIWQLGLVAVLLAGGAAVMSGRLTLGTFIAFDAYVLMLVFPMLDVGTFIVKGRQSGVSISRLLELEESPPEIIDRAASGKFAGELRGHLRFEMVGYDHAGPGAASEETPGGGALEKVSFEIGPGEMAAVVGPVGSGKSTLLRLVPRLVDPARGRVLLDGIDLRDIPLSTLRGAVGYVPQEAVLFSGTISENIRFAREWITAESVRRAAHLARLGKDLAGFTDGLETRVGVRGVSLSGGQKQRVALARALAGEPRVLVLDDATAALDAETEEALWVELRAVLPGLATLLVTHRTATLERADRILVLDRGRLIEEGTHGELARRGSVYRSIYRQHTLEERIAGGGDDVGGDPSPDGPVE